MKTIPPESQRARASFEVFIIKIYAPFSFFLGIRAFMPSFIASLELLLADMDVLV
jgi:hypothetical protein